MLPNTSVDSTTKDEEHKLRIRTTEEFFRMDSNYTYEGVANIRGIPTDVFISQRPSNIRGMTQMVCSLFSKFHPILTYKRIGLNTFLDTLRLNISKLAKVMLSKWHACVTECLYKKLLYTKSM